MKLSGTGLLAASEILRRELELSEERATWIAGLTISAYFGSDHPLQAAVEACAQCGDKGVYYEDLPDSGDTAGTWIKCDCIAADEQQGE
jgi:hypothetical protein